MDASVLSQALVEPHNVLKCQGGAELLAEIVRVVGTFGWAAIGSRSDCAQITKILKLTSEWVGQLKGWVVEICDLLDYTSLEEQEDKFMDSIRRSGKIHDLPAVQYSPNTEPMVLDVLTPGPCLSR